MIGFLVAAGWLLTAALLGGRRYYYEHLRDRPETDDDYWSRQI